MDFDNSIGYWLDGVPYVWNEKHKTRKYMIRGISVFDVNNDILNQSYTRHACMVLNVSKRKYVKETFSILPFGDSCEDIRNLFLVYEEEFLARKRDKKKLDFRINGQKTTNSSESVGPRFTITEFGEILLWSDEFGTIFRDPPYGVRSQIQTPKGTYKNLYDYVKKSGLRKDDIKKIHDYAMKGTNRYKYFDKDTAEIIYDTLVGKRNVYQWRELSWGVETGTGLATYWFEKYYRNTYKDILPEKFTAWKPPTLSILTYEDIIDEYNDPDNVLKFFNCGKFEKLTFGRECKGDMMYVLIFDNCICKVCIHNNKIDMYFKYNLIEFYPILIRTLSPYLKKGYVIELPVIPFIETIGYGPTEYGKLDDDAQRLILSDNEKHKKVNEMTKALLSNGFKLEEVNEKYKSYIFEG